MSDCCVISIQRRCDKIAQRDLPTYYSRRKLTNLKGKKLQYGFVWDVGCGREGVYQVAKGGGGK